ncbi:MAG TPA: YmdB family metallophosphoesterase, partial [Candidatus Goldiibacteriota bacterium]|nr:YmdB family metallophosphoesterase [Candidatus Goldiibacteriota bacterium]
MINVLFIGDINGKPGRNCIKAVLPGLIKEKNVNFTIANA